MYYTKLAKRFDGDVLATFLAERINSNLRVVLVSEAPEDIFPLFHDAWRRQHARLLAERDHEPDVAYMATLTDIVTSMQQATIVHGTANSIEEFLLMHPDELQGQVWEDRQILVACDDYSAQVCVKLLPLAAADFRLFVSMSVAADRLTDQMQKPQLHYLDQAQKDFRKLLRRQRELCAKMGVDLDDIVSGDVTNVAALGVALSKSQNSQLVERFRATQQDIADLRVICGRAKAHRSLSNEQLHGLKIVTKYLSQDPGPDAQLFDDPYGVRWLKSLST